VIEVDANGNARILDWPGEGKQDENLEEKGGDLLGRQCLDGVHAASASWRNGRWSGTLARTFNLIGGQTRLLSLLS